MRSPDHRRIGVAIAVDLWARQIPPDGHEPHPDPEPDRLRSALRDLRDARSRV